MPAVFAFEIINFLLHEFHLIIAQDNIVYAFQGGGQQSAFVRGRE